MTGTEKSFDELLGESLKGETRVMDVDSAFMGRLMHETRPFACIRNHPQRWVLSACALFLTCGAFGMWSGVIPKPTLFLAATTAKPAAKAAKIVETGPVDVPVQASAAPRVVRQNRPEPVSDDIDRAIGNALEYLVTQQEADGSFKGQDGKTTAIPALAGMAFLSKGCLADDAKYGPVLLKCLDYVLSQADMRDAQTFKGYMGNVGNGRMYAHTIATLFLSECSGMVDGEHQAKIDAVLPYAVKVILDAQNQKKGAQHLGGWRYTPNANDSDLSCSGWALMALKSARLNGAPVPDEAIEKAVLYIKRAYSEQNGNFGYQGPNQANAERLSGAAILCLELCGRHHEPESLKAAKYMEGCYRRALAPTAGNFIYYGLYYAAQGLFQIGGDVWKNFAPWMYEQYLKKQRADGSWVGSGQEGSPVYATSMTVLAFTVPYRMLPIYQRDETVDE